MGPNSRDRVTLELRGLREWLQALAASRQMTTSALVRQTLIALLDEELGEGDTRRNVPAIPATATATATVIDTPVVKVTLRLPASQARALARRARAADVSQGAYLARLIDGAPPSPLSPDHAQTVAALLASTDQLAVIGTDLNTFLRLLGLRSSSELERYRAGILSLAEDVRRHLAIAATLVAELRSARRPR
jgi:hypothetical protein